MKSGLLRGCAAMALVCCLGAEAQAQVNSAAPSASSYTIEAQDLSAALLNLSRQSKRSVFFDAVLVAAKRSPRIERAASFEDALRQMLSGSGLRFEITGDGSAVVLRQEAAARPAPAVARARPAPQSDVPPEEVTVTGTRIRGAAPSSPIIRLTQDQLRDEGFTSLGDAIRAIPQNFSGGQSPGLSLLLPTSAGENVGSGSSINLRGLGADATLTVINGHRLAYGGNRQSIDVSAVPLDALSRIEIVADGASAIYGSDAVAGVANIILKRDYEGATVRSRLGMSTDGGNIQQQYSAVGGTVWRTGGVIAAFDYEHDSAVMSEDRSYARILNPNQTLYPKLEHKNGIVSAHQDLGDNLHASLDTLFNFRKDSRQFQLTLSPPNLSNVFSSSRTILVAPSLTWDISRSWKLELAGSYGDDRIHYGNNQIVSGAFVPTLRACHCNRSQAAEVNVDGDLFDLQGGPAKVAFGGGYRSNRYQYLFTLGTTPSLHGSQDVYFGYGELSLPIVSPAMRIPFVDRLTFSAAARYEEYPGMDQVMTPKFGATWSPHQDFDLKASWGKSFKAPTLFQLYQVQSATNYPTTTFGGAGYPAGSTALYLSGGSTTLRPERATTWSVTAAAHPSWLPRTKLEVSYFNVAYTERVVAPITYITQGLTNPLYAPYVKLRPSLAEIAAATGGVRVTNATSVPGQFNPSTVVAIVDGRFVNATSQSLRGVDLSAQHEMDLDGRGSLLLNASASYLEGEQVGASGQGASPLSGWLFFPPRFRARGGGAWTNGPWMASSFVNYTGGVTDTRVTPNARIGSRATVDATVRYTMPLGQLREAEIAVSAQNLFNAKPDTIYITSPAQAAFDAANYTAIGRFVSVSFALRW